MWGYILGIILGSIFIVLMSIILLMHVFKKTLHNKKLKLIGLKSETRINNDIKTWAKQTKNLFLASSLFRYDNNKVFEVDSILLTPQALFVIEIKSIKGIIEGDGQLTHWKKKLGDKEFKISNPIIQNEKHIEHILKMINVKIPTVSFIIFSDRSDQLIIENIPGHVLVFKQNKLFDNLDDIEKSLSISLSDYEMRTIYGQIKSFKTNKKIDIRFHKKITTRGRA